MSVSGEFAAIAAKIISNIQQQMQSRTVKASFALKNAELDVIQGQGGGRVYRKPGGGTYQASAPGQVPAVRTGNYRNSWTPKAEGGGFYYKALIETNVSVPKIGNLGNTLEHGTPGGQMAPRPHFDKILNKAKPEVIRIYSEPYV